MTGNTAIGTRRADDLGGEIELPKDERSVNRWFNTAASRSRPNVVDFHTAYATRRLVVLCGAAIMIAASRAREG